MPPNRVSRREMLALLTTTSAVGIAGCNEGGTGTTPTEQDTSQPTQSETNTSTETTTDSEWDFEIQDFVGRDGTELHVDGDPYRFNGMMALLTHTKLGQKWTDRTMEAAADHDIMAYRCWGFPAPWNNVQATHQAPSEFNDEWFEYFDYTVAKAKETGVRLIVPLLQAFTLTRPRTV
ncbi:hypothetical protein [Natrinema halophilum]|uniref:hypothetical protein n=1 Tax=Natrinema halophilum TaxID=1699371 RepID=UPI001F178F67|nr:hypothetical protein [Natrinema halophilum]UHQ96231.1 hypothetical protein HYG82_21345 [Natrinema halophilum]